MVCTYKSRTQDEKSSLASSAVSCRHDPFPGVLFKLGSRHYSVERAVLLDSNNLVNVVKVRPELLVIRLYNSEN